MMPIFPQDCQESEIWGWLSNPVGQAAPFSPASVNSSLRLVFRLAEVIKGHFSFKKGNFPDSTLCIERDEDELNFLLRRLPLITSAIRCTVSESFGNCTSRRARRRHKPALLSSSSSRSIGNNVLAFINEIILISTNYFLNIKQ